MKHTAKCWLFFLFVILPSISLPVYAKPVAIKNLRAYQAPDHARLVFDISGPLKYSLNSFHNPERIVVDIDNAELVGLVDTAQETLSTVTRIRSGQQKGGALRIVLDLARPVKPKTFVLSPAGIYGHRLVLDLYDQNAEDSDAVVAEPRRRNEAPKEHVIAIDAGHGGEDPGALGRRYRTREKDVVLAIARELARLIDKEPGMRSVLTRKGDYYIGLDQRQKIAKKKNASIFISIHADAVPARKASGSSVYALTTRGESDRLAKYLAESENRADQYGGVFSEVEDPTLKRVLFDLSETANIGLSLDLGSDILTHLRHVGPLHRRKVGQAGFVVLKSPDIISVLVETAFISNPTEEKKLRSRDFQKSVANSIFRGVRQFVARKNLRPNAHVVSSGPSAQKPKEHVVRRGESLISIARKYDVHIDSLRFANNIVDSNIVIGRKLIIP